MLMKIKNLNRSTGKSTIKKPKSPMSPIQFELWRVPGKTLNNFFRGFRVFVKYIIWAKHFFFGLILMDLHRN